jgi:hypothetical protein
LAETHLVSSLQEHSHAHGTLPPKVSHIKYNSSGSYSPDLSPAAFFLFLKLKVSLKGHQFGFTEKIHLQKMLEQPTSFFKNIFRTLGKMKISL